MSENQKEKKNDKKGLFGKLLPTTHSDCCGVKIVPKSEAKKESDKKEQAR
jgi:hypothetical protein